MARTRRPSAQTISVIQALADDPAKWRYGYELSKQLGLKAGTLYPILIRLYEQGILETDWELDIPGGIPPRHLYRLTGEGVEAAKALKGADPKPSPALRLRTEGTA